MKEKEVIEENEEGEDAVFGIVVLTHQNLPDNTYNVIQEEVVCGRVAVHSHVVKIEAIT